MTDEERLAIRLIDKRASIPPMAQSHSREVFFSFLSLFVHYVCLLLKSLNKHRNKKTLESLFYLSVAC